MLERVRQRLLHDPVGGQPEAGVDLPVADGELDRQPGAADLLHQRRQPVQPRRRLVRSGVVGVRVPGTEHPDRALQLGDGLPPTGLDVGDGGARLVRAVVEQPVRDAGPDPHQHDVVRDDVVELPRDPEPLLEHGAPLVRPALQRQLGVAAFQLGAVLAQTPRHEAEAAADQIRQRVEDGQDESRADR